MPAETRRWKAYLQALEQPFIKLTRLRFLNPDGSTAFAVDSNYRNKHSSAFLQDGSLNVNLQNGSRRQATVKLSNLDRQFDYNVNKVWFGQSVALDMGLVLPDGTDFYLPQGVFYVKDPTETYKPNEKTVSYNLVDKWAMLDGSLGGNLDGIYEAPVNSNIFDAMKALLLFDKGNGQVYDNVPPLFTNYYNNKLTMLPDGTSVPLTSTPYTYRNDSTSGTFAQILLELAGMLNAWIGYDQSGALRVDPSQDDILDTSKPVMWNFSPTKQQYLGRTDVIKNSEMYNDVIVRGESLDDYGAVGGRATNFDPASDTNADLVGLKTLQIDGAGLYTQKQCEDLAEFTLKRRTILQRSITIESQQMFHIVENNLVTIRRPDLEGQPLERYLINGFTLPIGQTGAMTINATAVNDFPISTITRAFV